MPTLPRIDTSLLDGIRFRCRPGCGLCCYTTPAVDPAEGERLIQIDPNLELLEGEGSWKFVAARGDGGACGLLSECRCRAYAVRPFCCQEFPLSVHLGLRPQATAVLSCPGVSFVGDDGAEGEARVAPAPLGLEVELAAVEVEYARAPAARRLSESSRRWSTLRNRLRRRGGWSEPSEIRAELRPEVLTEVRSHYPPPSPPSGEDGVESLPMWFDPGKGLVAVSEHAAGWEVRTVEETGTRSRSLGVWPAPSEPPRLTAPGERVLGRYLELLLDRDFTFWAAAERVRTGRDRSLPGAVREDLGQFGALVLARAELIDRFRSGGGRSLGPDLVREGVRATDGEFLDRPTLGWVL
jgi:Fe-S-cluster containining protein